MYVTTQREPHLMSTSDAAPPVMINHEVDTCQPVSDQLTRSSLRLLRKPLPGTLPGLAIVCWPSTAVVPIAP